MRAAIYFAPDPGSALARRASAWLGREAGSGRELERIAAPDLHGVDLDTITASPRRYGFHATLKAPFALADGMTLSRLGSALAGFAARRRAIKVSLTLAELGGFLALVPEAHCEDLDTLAAATVVQFEQARAPLAEAELARRRQAALTPRQDELLRRWGYPYVLDEFRFHMTLTGRLEDGPRRRVLDYLRAVFADVLAEPVDVDRLALFVEDAPGRPFRTHSFHKLGTAALSEPFRERRLSA